MAWTGSSGVCPCVWNANFGGSDCTPQVPGVNKTIAVICMSVVDAITYTAADDANPDTTGVITDITLTSGGNQAYTMTNLTDKVEVTSGESVNDNGGTDRAETVNGKGLIDTQALNFVKNYLNYDVIIVFEDNDGKLWAMGHDGGMSMTEWAAVFGLTTGDEKAVSYTFENTTRSAMQEVVFAGGNEAFFTQLTTQTA